MVLVVNPSAQNGQLGRRWPDLSAALRRDLGGFEEAVTSGPGDATRLAREALESGAQTVVAIGGDGTINEVVNGFFEGDRAVAPDAALGVLPFGTGGDFRKTVGLPGDTRAAAKILAAGQVRTIDVGHLEMTGDGGAPQSRVFANIASFGMSGVVDEYVNKASKRLGGRLSFMLATARAGLSYQNQRVHLVLDGDEKSALESHGQHRGGGQRPLLRRRHVHRARRRAR